MKFGIVTERNPDNCKVRVRFTENNIVSGWLFVLVSTSKDNKHFYLPDVNEQVVCMMDANLETGVVLGAIYSKVDTVPAGVGEDVEAMVFSDGTVVKYDRGAHRLTIDCAGDITVTCQNADVTASDGATITTPTLTVDGSLTVTGSSTMQGNIEVSGNVTATGNLEATGDVKAGPGGLITLLLHKHPTAAPGAPSPPIP